ncbi:hypothetical protein TrRE_jg9368 [Triparma retinervis]|uniref:Uncharacterized protein n=1 Tax=Triparma retinervis TaxID=2557542 RepID=A0A9W7ANM7_9STRA|nr:hypothetical protein TrRE_jg9368 [Triparma retinervis]
MKLPNDEYDTNTPLIWERYSIDFEKDDAKKVAVDFLTIFATSLYVKLYAIITSISFPGWQGKLSGDTLPDTIARVCLLCFSWVVANLRENGFARDVEETRLVKFGSKAPKTLSDKLLLVSLQTTNTWLAFAVVVALISSVLGGVGLGQEETTGKVVAVLLPVMCVARTALFLNDKDNVW